MKEQAVLAEELPSSIIHPKESFPSKNKLNEIEAFIVFYNKHKLKPEWANDYTINRLGYTVEEITYLGIDQFFEYYHHSSGSFARRLNKIIRDKSDFSHTIIRIRTKGNNWIWALGTACNFGDSEYLIAYATPLEISDML